MTMVEDVRARPRRGRIPVDTPVLDGRIKWFDPDKGYGFIEMTGEKDIFIHINNLPNGIDKLTAGQPVRFQTETTKKGVRAVNIEL